MEIAQDVARKLIESNIEHGDPLPPNIKRAFNQRKTKMTAKIPVGISIQAPTG
jgi:hypothetical protein